MKTLNLKVADDVKDRLRLLQKLTKATTMTEVVRNALAVYECIVTETRDGSKIELVNADGVRTRLMIVPAR